MSPAAAPLSNLDTLKQSLCSISSAAFFSSIEVSYLLPKPDTPSELSLLKNQTVWASKLQPKDALFVVEMCTFLMEKQKHCTRVLLSRYVYIPIFGFNMGNGFRSKLDIPVSLDTKCTFCGVLHDSVENAQKSIQNGMTDISEPPSRTQLSLTMPFQMKVLEMHRKQSTPPPQLQLSHAANWRR